MVSSRLGSVVVDRQRIAGRDLVFAVGQESQVGLDLGRGLRSQFPVGRCGLLQLGLRGATHVRHGGVVAAERRRSAPAAAAPTTAGDCEGDDDDDDGCDGRARDSGAAYRCRTQSPFPATLSMSVSVSLPRRLRPVGTTYRRTPATSPLLVMCRSCPRSDHSWVVLLVTRTPRACKAPATAAQSLRCNPRLRMSGCALRPVCAGVAAPWSSRHWPSFGPRHRRQLTWNSSTRPARRPTPLRRIGRGGRCRLVPGSTGPARIPILGRLDMDRPRFGSTRGRRTRRRGGLSRSDRCICDADAAGRQPRQAPCRDDRDRRRAHGRRRAASLGDSDRSRRDRPKREGHIRRCRRDRAGFGRDHRLARVPVPEWDAPAQGEHWDAHPVARQPCVRLGKLLRDFRRHRPGARTRRGASSKSRRLSGSGF